MSLAALALVDTAPRCAPLAELFTADHDDHPARPDQLAQVCARCPLLEPCRADAIRDPRVGGFAGGLTTEQRDDIRAGRRPRPPKEPRMTDIAPVRFADEIRDALEQGRAPAAVAQELLVPVTEVLAVQKQMQQQAQPASPQLVVPRPLPAPAAPPAPTPAVRDLIAEGLASDRAAIRRKAEKAKALLDDLAAAVDADREAAAERAREAAEREAARAEVERLRKQLAEAQAKMRGGKQQSAAGKARKAQLDYSAAEVRAWARDNGIDCPARGRFLPADVVDAWRKATGR